MASNSTMIIFYLDLYEIRIIYKQPKLPESDPSNAPQKSAIQAPPWNYHKSTIGQPSTYLLKYRISIRSFIRENKNSRGVLQESCNSTSRVQEERGLMLTNHQDSRRQSIPQSHESNIPIYPTNGLHRTLSLFPFWVQFRHHYIGRMWDNCCPNTSDITTEEGNSSLLETIIGGLRLAKIVVNGIYRILEGCELHHSVWDLAGPERVETFVQAAQN